MALQIVKIICLISYPIFFLVTFVLLRLAKVDPTKRSYSFLGATKPYGKYFDMNLIMAGIFQLIIFSSIYIYHLIEPTRLNIISFMFLSLTTITGIIVGIITLNVSEKAHLMISIIGFVSSLPGWLLFGLSLYKDYMYSGLLMMTSGVILIPFLMTVGAKTKELVGNYESLFFFAAYLTNIVIYVTYFAH